MPSPGPPGSGALIELLLSLLPRLIALLQLLFELFDLLLLGCQSVAQRLHVLCCYSGLGGRNRLS